MTIENDPDKDNNKCTFHCNVLYIAEMTDFGPSFSPMPKVEELYLEAQIDFFSMVCFETYLLGLYYRLRTFLRELTHPNFRHASGKKY